MIISRVLTISYLSILAVIVMWLIDMSKVYVTNINLLLGLIPLVISSILLYVSKYKGGMVGVCVGVLVFLWVIFFPNAPYLLTSMIKPGLSIEVRVAFMVYGLVGVVLSLTTLQQFGAILRKFDFKGTRLLQSLMLFLAGVGIYLGKFPRWNSWDLLVNPLPVFGDVVLNLSRLIPFVGIFSVIAIPSFLALNKLFPLEDSFK